MVSDFVQKLEPTKVGVALEALDYLLERQRPLAVDGDRVVVPGLCPRETLLRDVALDVVRRFLES